VNNILGLVENTDEDVHSRWTDVWTEMLEGLRHGV
jgi:hypothetical protein